MADSDLAGLGQGSRVAERRCRAAICLVEVSVVASMVITLCRLRSPPRP